MAKTVKMRDKPIVFSALEVANICGVVNQTAINWIHNNYLKAFKTPGGQFRVYPEDLVEFMEKRNMRIPSDLLDCCNKKTVVTPKTVLVVDDDRALNDVVAKFLKAQDESIQILQAFDGFEAGSQMVAKQPKCIILDLDLPGIDGKKLCRHIKESEAFGKPSIIVVTAMDDPETEKECMELGVLKFFRKPLNLPELSSTIASLDD
ncbi:MAG: response regulator [Treponema sp.]|nr:response regulator [Treponema sp.]MBR4385598.1 response regulator [Treponema sp.]